MTGHLSKQVNAAPVRTFVAVELPDDRRRELGQLRDAFRGHDAVVRWSAPQLLHLTLFFLGNLVAERLEAVKEAAQKSAATVSPFELALSGLGAFPSSGSPRVIWVGLDQGAGLETLMLLSRALEGELQHRGFPGPDHPFRPHITLARTRDGISASQRRALGETLRRVQIDRPVTGRFDVRELVVMRSDLRPTGPLYTPVAVYPLRRAGPAGQE